jgi:hypothetical protein
MAAVVRHGHDPRGEDGKRRKGRCGDWGGRVKHETRVEVSHRAAADELGNVREQSSCDGKDREEGMVWKVLDAGGSSVKNKVGSRREWVRRSGK